MKSRVGKIFVTFAFLSVWDDRLGKEGKKSVNIKTEGTRHTVRSGFGKRTLWADLLTGHQSGFSKH